VQHDDEHVRGSLHDDFPVPRGHDLQRDGSLLHVTRHGWEPEGHCPAGS
jgi:hypothetical protein